MRRPLGSSGLARAAATAPQPVAVLAGSRRLVPDRRTLRSTFATSTVVALAIFVGSAARVIPALLAVPIQRDLNWSESDVTGPLAISIAISALGAPLAARSLARVGARSMLLVSLSVLSASLALSSLATSPWHLLLFWGVGVGLSGSLSASILAAMTGLRDHAGHCGTALGLFTSVQFLGSAAGLLLASRATEALGWRFVLSAGAAATLVATFAVVLVLHARAGRTSPESVAVARLRSRNVTAGRGSIWIIAAIFFICGASATGLIDSRLGILCMGNGLGLSSSADILAIVAVSGGIGSAASGLLADRYPPRMLLTLYFVARALALLWLPFSSLSLVELARFGAFYGLDAALTFPALVKLFSRDLDQQAIGTMMSWMMMAHIIGAATTSAWVGFFGIAGYAVSFTLVGFMCLLAAGLVRISGE
jgi:predicted MFS family arabinose efflux permease